MRNAEDVLVAMRGVADCLHAAKLTADKCDRDEEMILSRLRNIDSEKAGAIRRIEMYHCQYDALQDELDRIHIAEAEAMVIA